MNTELIERYAGQVAQAYTGAATTAAIVAGDRLGLYDALARLGSATPAELAAATGCHERYLREWAHQQTAAGLLHHHDGRFTLPPEGRAVLADPASPASMAGGALLPTGWFQNIDHLTDSFRAGTGIAWDRQPQAVHEGTARFFESTYRADLIGSWLPALDGVEQRLRDGITVADVGCGFGASTRLMAEAYPASTFVGYDRHEPSVRAARAQPLPPGLRFEVAAADAYPAGGYGLICMFDTFHDLSDPLAAAAHARKSLAADGTLLLVEPAAEDDPAANLAEPMAAFSYAASLFQCLPASLAEPPGYGLGAQAGAQAVRDILLKAGFTDFRIAARTPVNAVYQAR